MKNVWNDLPSLQDQVTKWAANEAAIRACLLVGSRARVDPPADAYSDIDLIFIGEDFTPYTQSPTWIHHFGAVWVYLFEPTGGGDPEYLVVYEGGRKIDVVFWPIDVLTAPLDDGKRSVLERGFRVLFDKTGLAKNLQPPTGKARPAEVPTAADYDRIVRQFWYAAYQTMRWLRRRELYMAEYSIGKLRAEWLTMLEWSMHAAHGLNYDTWYMGRFIERWMQPLDRETLVMCFPSYSDESIRAALTHLCMDFRRHAEQTAQAYGFIYPMAADEAIRGWIENL